MDFEIRAFLSGDHAQALHLWQTTEGIGTSSDDDLENISRFLQRNPGLSFVAFEGDAVVGTILCGHDGRRGLIHHLAVSSGHRRRGLGRALVSRAIAALREAEISKCHLFVFKHNGAGRAFWQSIGAEERLTLAPFSIPTRLTIELG